MRGLETANLTRRQSFHEQWYGLGLPKRSLSHETDKDWKFKMSYTIHPSKLTQASLSKMFYVVRLKTARIRQFTKADSWRRRHRRIDYCISLAF